MTEYTDEYFTNPDGLRQHYRDYNKASPNAPCILCMPGLTRNARDFEDIAQHLSDRCRVICVEQRGRGDSEWDPIPERYLPITYVSDMVALLNHLKVKQIIAIGTSLGGLITIMIQAMHPGLLRGAIINDIGPEVNPKGIERIKSYVGKGNPLTSWEEVVEAVKKANAAVYPDFCDKEWLWFAKKLYVERNGTPIALYDPAISKNLNSEQSQSAPDLWPLFQSSHTIPMLALRGETSDILKSSTLKRMAAEHPTLKPVTVPGVGHVPLMNEPQSVDAIDAFIEQFL